MASIIAELRPHFGRWRIRLPFLIGAIGLRTDSVLVREAALTKATDVAAMFAREQRMKADIIRLTDQIREIADERDRLRIENDMLRGALPADEIERVLAYGEMPGEQRCADFACDDVAKKGE